MSLCDPTPTCCTAPQLKGKLHYYSDSRTVSLEHKPDDTVEISATDSYGLDRKLTIRKAADGSMTMSTHDHYDGREHILKATPQCDGSTEFEGDLGGYKTSSGAHLNFTGDLKTLQDAIGPMLPVLVAMALKFREMPQLTIGEESGFRWRG